MPHLTKSFPAYRKHKASGQAFVELNGRRHYLGPHGTTVSGNEWDRLIAEWLACGRQPERREPEAAEIAVVELIVAYLEHAQTYYRKHGKQTTEFRDITLSLRPLRKLYGDCPCVDFGPIKLEAVRRKMIDDGLSRGVINQRIGRIRRAFKWGVSKQLFPVAVHQALQTVEGLHRGRSEARETDPVRPVDDAVVEQTLAFLPAVVGDMIRLQRLTGMRPEEVCTVRPTDVDRSEEVWFYRPQSHKTEHHSKKRIIPIGPAAQEILLRYLARDGLAYCFSPLDSEAKRLAARHAARVVPLSCGSRCRSSNRQGNAARA